MTCSVFFCVRFFPVRKNNVEIVNKFRDYAVFAYGNHNCLIFKVLSWMGLWAN